MVRYAVLYSMKIHIQSVLCWVVYSLTCCFLLPIHFCTRPVISFCSLGTANQDVYDRSCNACCLCRNVPAVSFCSKITELTWQSCSNGSCCSDYWKWSSGGARASTYSGWTWWQTSRARMWPFLHEVIFSIFRCLHFFHWLVCLCTSSSTSLFMAEQVNHTSA